MDSGSNRPSPFAAATQSVLHRNPPLAPSQELAYREKCIALKRRLMEIEQNNDCLRKRLEREKRFQDKMRLNRAILLNHLKEMMDSPDKNLSRQELETLGVGLQGGSGLVEHLDYDLGETPGTRGVMQGDYIMDDSSAASEDEPEPEPQPQPSTRKRARNQDTPMGNNSSLAATPTNPGSTYHHSSLPSLAPAQSHSPTSHQDQPLLTSSFRASSSGLPGTTSLQTGSYHASQQHNGAPSFSHYSSPVAQHQETPTPVMSSVETALPAAPVRPAPPYEQFTAHMEPQLLIDNFPTSQMGTKIRQLWNEMSDENRGLWEQRYHEQMSEYTKAMDEWKRGQRKAPAGGFAPVTR